MKHIILSSALFFLIACTPKEAQPKYAKGVSQPDAQSTAVKTRSVPTPRKPIKLRKVQPTNYSSEYMYPEDKHPQPIKTSDTSKDENKTAFMSKEECILMIGQEKFDKYTQMFSDENATLKRCTMMKAMQK